MDVTKALTFTTILQPFFFYYIFVFTTLHFFFSYLVFFNTTRSYIGIYLTIIRVRFIHR